ncbi:hypothetical protein IGI52_000441 [Enterococcus sp. DIV0187]
MQYYHSYQTSGAGRVLLSNNCGSNFITSWRVEYIKLLYSSLCDGEISFYGEQIGCNYQRKALYRGDKVLKLFYRHLFIETKITKDSNCSFHRKSKI